jgi:hypothetical protein
MSCSRDISLSVLMIGMRLLGQMQRHMNVRDMNSIRDISVINGKVSSNSSSVLNVLQDNNNVS